MLHQSDWPTFMLVQPNMHITEPGNWIWASSGSNGTLTLPVRSPDPSAGQIRRTDIGIYRIICLSTARPVTIARASSDLFAIAGGLTATSFVLNPGESVDIINDGGYWVPCFGASTPAIYRKTTTTAAATVTLSRSASFWAFTGSSASTWTLPDLVTNTGMEYLIKNKGSADITLQRAGSDQLYTTAAVTSITITAGNSARIVNDGSHWVVM